MERTDTIRLFRIDTSTSMLIPVFTGTGIHAGFPSPAQDYLQEAIDLNHILIKNPSSTFIGDITGDSMIDVFVANPCKVIVDRSETPCNNDIVIACVDNEFVCRVFERSNAGVITLCPQNRQKNYKPITILKGMDARMWGVVTQILIDPRVRYLYDRLG